MDLDAATFETKNEAAKEFLKGVRSCIPMWSETASSFPTTGSATETGRIASGFVESAVNQVVSKRMAKRQQMGWSQRGAHLLLQIRTRVLNEEWENTFRRWYSAFRPRVDAEVNTRPKHPDSSASQLARSGSFRLILRWNQSPPSGSSCIGRESRWTRKRRGTTLCGEEPTFPRSPR